MNLNHERDTKKNTAGGWESKEGAWGQRGYWQLRLRMTQRCKSQPTGVDFFSGLYTRRSCLTYGQDTLLSCVSVCCVLKAQVTRLHVMQRKCVFYDKDTSLFQNIWPDILPGHFGRVINERKSLDKRVKTPEDNAHNQRSQGSRQQDHRYTPMTRTVLSNANRRLTPPVKTCRMYPRGTSKLFCWLFVDTLCLIYISNTDMFIRASTAGDSPQGCTSVWKNGNVSKSI